MENIAQLSLDEAKKLYNSPTASDDIKLFLLSKFTKEELERKPVTQEDLQEDFNKFFEEKIFTLIDKSKSWFLNCDGGISQTPTSRIRLNTSNGDWLFDYDYNQKNPHFHYSVYIIYFNIVTKVAVSEDELQPLMKNMVEKYFNLHDVTPYHKSVLSIW